VHRAVGHSQRAGRGGAGGGGTGSRAQETRAPLITDCHSSHTPLHRPPLVLEAPLSLPQRKLTLPSPHSVLNPPAEGFGNPSLPRSLSPHTAKDIEVPRLPPDAAPRAPSQHNAFLIQETLATPPALVPREPTAKAIRCPCKVRPSTHLNSSTDLAEKQKAPRLEGRA